MCAIPPRYIYGRAHDDSHWYSSIKTQSRNKHHQWSGYFYHSYYYHQPGWKSKHFLWVYQFSIPLAEQLVATIECKDPEDHLDRPGSSSLQEEVFHLEGVKTYSITTIILDIFLHSRKMSVQTVRIVAGVTLNGCIAAAKGSFLPYSSDEDRAWLREQIEVSDVLVMGRKTFDLHVKRFRKPMIVFTRSVEDGIFSEQADLHFFHDSKDDFLNLCDLLRYKKILVLGGAEVYAWFFEHRLVHEVCLTLEPFFIQPGKQLLQARQYLDQEKWHLQKAERLNERGTLLLHYSLR